MLYAQVFHFIFLLLQSSWLFWRLVIVLYLCSSSHCDPPIFNFRSNLSYSKSFILSYSSFPVIDYQIYLSNYSVPSNPRFEKLPLRNMSWVWLLNCSYDINSTAHQTYYNTVTPLRWPSSIIKKQSYWKHEVKLVWAVNSHLHKVFDAPWTSRHSMVKPNYFSLCKLC